MMNHPIAPIMAVQAKVKKDVECGFFGKKHKSRGWYICENDGYWHLHRDGEIRAGVKSVSGIGAFWPTEQEAREFYKAWKMKVLSEST